MPSPSPHPPSESVTGGGILQGEAQGSEGLRRDHLKIAQRVGGQSHVFVEG